MRASHIEEEVESYRVPVQELDKELVVRIAVDSYLQCRIIELVVRTPLDSYLLCRIKELVVRIAVDSCL